MVLKPQIRNEICLNSHPKGCAQALVNQIQYVRNSFKSGSGAPASAHKGAPRLVLVVGSSTGYGLASRITAAFGYGAATVGLSLEKAGTATKAGTPGWYNNRAFELEAAGMGLAAQTLNGDAYADELKIQAIEALKVVAAQAGIQSQVDLIVYSLASPVRTDPQSGVLYRSVIKPLQQAYTGKTVHLLTGEIIEKSVAPATAEEVAATVKVMGGEDWERWIDALDAAGMLSTDTKTVAYTYIGPSLSWAIYKNGSIGQAKADLERAAQAINAKLAQSLGQSKPFAWVSVNKAVVTRASAVIPIIPLYISCLFKVMKEKGLHEGCIEQMVRLFRDRLYRTEALAGSEGVLVDSEGRIRLDDWEMREDVQQEVRERMEKITQENLAELCDLAGFRHDFLEAHGFDVPGIDYEAEVDPSGI
ncbi:MAG: trans-2-enoyl-CoA reductase family protein [Spirochaetaceae bacterium]|jgi:enoyl-[acyl-carrier protein] reductase/trans-2-enoyl-CoA reductase (NAD+)|nr:trans-2-enoyl-CoA reductase family protein [Spirochaetaceae bacterium]